MQLIDPEKCRRAECNGEFLGEILVNRVQFAAFATALIGLGAPTAVADDITAEMRTAYQTLTTGLGDPGPFILEGRMSDLRDKAIAIFPVDKRTGIQALVLGNALFEYDPNTAYALHKEAAMKLPDEANAQLEWAIEQHRAGEFEGAVTAYTKYVKDKPNFALAWGLLAECLLQTGKTQAAVDAWKQSEAAQVGTLVQFESFVCQVHAARSLLWERADLISKAKGGDIDAAEGLIALDCDYERDWWNRGPHQEFLKKDLEILQAIRFQSVDRVLPILCTVEAALANESGDGNVATILRNHGLLCDEKHTLPSSNRLLAALIGTAEASDAVSPKESLEYWGTQILERAKASRDAEVYNVAAHLYLNSPELPKIQQQGWEATADERFAVVRLIQLRREDKLTLDHPELTKATRLFPNNGFIAEMRLDLAENDKRPLEMFLTRAILAEYSRLTPRGPLMRPSARILRSYFSRLEKELGTMN